jgi:lipopolysaccharide biosynthesis regulator YciM
MAEQHLEKAMDLDPLNLSAAIQLIDLYNKNGEGRKATQLSEKLTSIVHPNKAEGKESQ